MEHDDSRESASGTKGESRQSLEVSSCSSSQLVLSPFRFSADQRRLLSPALFNSRSQEHLSNSFLAQGARGVRLFNNPKKAWAIVTQDSGKVEVCNSIFRQILDLDSKQTDIRIFDYVEHKNNHDIETLEQLELDSETGETVFVNGEVVNLVRGDGSKISVSLTTKNLSDSQSSMLVCLEPVYKVVGHIELDSGGLITNLDENAETIFQLRLPSCLGDSIDKLIPRIDLPEVEPGSRLKLAWTGRTEDNLYFPISVILRREELGSAVDYNPSIVPGIFITVWVYSSLTGLLILNPQGEILSCDPGLSSLVLGYGPDQLVNKTIEQVLPGFYDEFDLPSAEHTDDDDLGCEELSQADDKNENDLELDINNPVETVEEESSPLEEISINISNFRIQSPKHISEEDSGTFSSTQKENLAALEPKSPIFKRPLLKTPVKIPMELFTSTPASHSNTTSTPASHNNTDNTDSPVRGAIAPTPSSGVVSTPIQPAGSSSGTPLHSHYATCSATPLRGMSASSSTSTRTPLSNRKPRVRTEFSVDRSRPKLKDRNLFGEVTNRSSFDENSTSLPTGCFFGLARHKNGTDISSLYQVKKVSLKDKEDVYCVWLSRDSEDIAAKTHNNITLTSSIVEEERKSIPGPGSGPGHPADQSIGSLSQDSLALEALQDLGLESLIEGPYSDKYNTLDQLGKGAFGCVRSAYRKSDKELVVVKFICKRKIIKENWITDDSGVSLPFEASLLTALKHANIVEVLDVFNNQFVVQMVMSKHGDMDLFEFIDRNPIMEETLASHIYGQIVEGVSYLHGKGILHRDLKDENVIINNKFDIQIIDFGSATVFQTGQKFTTFYGTVEYCAPEVLKGNPYDGEQVEAWALGVLLYILIYGENPFYDVADTVRAELHPPHHEVSGELWELIESILTAAPATRASLWYIKEHPWVQQTCNLEEYRIQDVIPCHEYEINPVRYYKQNPTPQFLTAQISEEGECLDGESDRSSLEDGLPASGPCTGQPGLNEPCTDEAMPLPSQPSTSCS